jgi:hypothetical protein
MLCYASHLTRSGSGAEGGGGGERKAAAASRQADQLNSCIGVGGKSAAARASPAAASNQSK